MFGEDCRRAVRVNMLFTDIFDSKRHKNLETQSENDQTLITELDRAPSAVFNPFACELFHKGGCYTSRN